MDVTIVIDSHVILQEHTGDGLIFGLKLGYRFHKMDITRFYIDNP